MTHQPESMEENKNIHAITAAKQVRVKKKISKVDWRSTKFVRGSECDYNGGNGIGGGREVEEVGQTGGFCVHLREKNRQFQRRSRYL